MSRMYQSLATVAERMKLRDLATYARLRKQDAALAAKAEALRDTLSKETAAAPAGDVLAAQALQRYASIAARHADQLAAKRRALGDALEATRQDALRATGRARALEILEERERLHLKQQRQRREERMMVR